MKTALKQLSSISVLLFAVLSLILNSCTSDDDSELIVGKWKVTSIKTDAGEGAPTTDYYMVFNQDGSGYALTGSIKNKYNWDVSVATLTLFPTDGNESESATILTLDESNLVLKYTDGSDSKEVTLKKVSTDLSGMLKEARTDVRVLHILP